MGTLTEAVEKIIQQQEAIIGPLAVEQARRVKGLKTDGSGKVEITGSTTEVLGELVDQYARLFGRASVEVCKEALRGLDIPENQVPVSLR